MSILAHMRHGLRHLANTLLEQDCLLCGSASGAEILCSDCQRDLPRLPDERCPRCALPSPRCEICGQCLRQPPHFDATLAALRYDFPLDKLVQSFKYGHRLALGPYFGRKLAELVGNIDAELIVPLPLHPARLRERGFNQALELARPLAAARGWQLDKALCQRTRHTSAQAGLHWPERTKNIRGAFHCTADLSGTRIVLVDDVMTTGASLDECARVLKLHGSHHVTALVLARALPKNH